MYHSQLVEVWNDTVEHYKHMPEIQSIVYNGKYKITAPTDITIRASAKTVVQIIQGDCIDVANKIGSNNKICILNMADWLRPGGNVASGSRAQEEELYRRSNLHTFLSSTDYPMKPLQTIYSKNVEFYRHGVSSDYSIMSVPIVADVISAPALVGPQLTDDCNYFANPGDAEFMKDKIRQLLLIAHHHSVDTLILSAWGCGAFGGPPLHTAQLFKDVLVELDGLIPTVVFAILGSNFSVFNSVLAN
jgi:uncharacterized protein (TIGR02452 family)